MERRPKVYRLPHRTPRRRLLLDLDAERYSILDADLDRLAAAALAALHAAIEVLDLALDGGAR